MDTKTLRVAEALSRDVARGAARISLEVASELELSSGDVIEIKGKKQ